MNNFIVGEALSSAIETQTVSSEIKFERRDFVEPLIEFCLNQDYRAILGIVFGLRATGKTVGMLQAAEELSKQGHKVAYARFNYDETDIKEVNAEILKLASDGCTHFFIDEAPYLSGFLNNSAEWADRFVPCNRIKIVISGTDSFLLWEAQIKSLFHRYIRFPTNFCNFREYTRITGKGYEDFKKNGGLFTAEDMPEFIQTAIVDNLLNTIKHCMDDANRTTFYTDVLYGINASVIYKAVISILKCVVEDTLKEHFAHHSDKKNIPELGEALRGFTSLEKRDIKERVAESVELYRNFTPVNRPNDVIEALLQFLIKIGCLFESITATSDIYGGHKTLYFSHNALMNYALEETRIGIEHMTDTNVDKFTKGLIQAAEGSLNENIVYAHLMLACDADEKIYRYRDDRGREIDAVIINRDKKTIKLFEIKSKSTTDDKRVALKDARHMFDTDVIENIGANKEFSVIRVIVSKDKTHFVNSKKGLLLIINIEDLLMQYKHLSSYLDTLIEMARKPVSEKNANEPNTIPPKKTLLQKLDEGKNGVDKESPHPKKPKSKSKNER